MAEPLHTFPFEPPPFELLEPAPALELDGQSLGTEGDVPPGEGPEPIALTEGERSELYQDLEGVLDAIEQAMVDRKKAQKEIEEAYDLVFDPLRGGIQPGASKLASEMTRDHVNQCYARIANAIFGLRPMCDVSVAGEDAGDQPTRERLEEAEKLERFLDSYKDTMGVPRVLPMGLHRSCKVGGAWVRILWESQSRRYRIRNEMGNPEWTRRSHGAVKWRLIRNQDHLLWPLDVLDPQEACVAGHDTYLTPAEFRQWALRHEIDPELAQQVLDATRENKTDGSVGEDLQRRHVDARGLNPLDGEVRLTELWVDLPLPASYHTRTGTEPAPFQVFLSRTAQKVLWIGWNPLDCQLHPYFQLPYWTEDGCVLPSGVGHEVQGNQRIASALLNLLMDNMRVVGAHLVLVKEGSTAENYQDKIAPGARVVVDDKDDITAFSLGGELTNIYQAISFNENAARRNSGVSDILSGRGDASMKSGSTATAVQTLASEGGKKFQRVDENLKEAIGEMFAFSVLLLQQYAPNGIYYEHVSEEDARVLERLRFYPPTGDLTQLFRIRARGPSASTNQDVQRQNLMILYGLVEKYIGMLNQLAQQAWAMTNPAGIHRLVEESLTFLGDFMHRILVVHDVVDIKPPHPGQPTPMEQYASQIQLMLQQVQQQAEQLQQQVQMKEAENAELRQLVPIQATEEVGVGPVA